MMRMGHLRPCPTPMKWTEDRPNGVFLSRCLLPPRSVSESLFLFSVFLFRWLQVHVFNTVILLEYYQLLR